MKTKLEIMFDKYRKNRDPVFQKIETLAGIEVTVFCGETECVNCKLMDECDQINEDGYFTGDMFDEEMQKLIKKHPEYML